MTGEYPILINGAQMGTLCIRKEGLMTVFEAECRDPGQLLRLSVYGEREAYLGVMIPTDTGLLRLEKQLSRNALRSFPETIRYAGPAGETLSGPEKSENNEKKNEQNEETLAEECAAPMVEKAAISGGEVLTTAGEDCFTKEEAAPSDEEKNLTAEETVPTAEENPLSDESHSSSEEKVPSNGNIQPEAEAQRSGERGDTSDSVQTASELKDSEMHSDEGETAEEEQTVRWRKGAGGALVGSCGEARFLAIPLKPGTIPIWENYEKRRIDQVDYAVFEIKNGKIF